MPRLTMEAIDGNMPDALPTELHPNNWPELEKKDSMKIWHHYEEFLLQYGYHIMGSMVYNTLGTGVTNIPAPAADPFNPTDTQTFIHYYRPKDLSCTRRFSSWQPSINICFGIDSFMRQIVFKALEYDSTELKVLRILTTPSLRADKRNRAIPVLNFLETKDIVIVVMAGWGFSWDAPPCGNMSTRLELAIKLTECLALLHELGIAHGDIHPHNIVISHADSRADWEAQPEDDFRKHATWNTLSLTLEQVEHDSQGYGKGKIDVFAADVYNLGKTLETELTAAIKVYGKEPFPTRKYEQYRDILLAMTDPRPESRPMATRALASLREVTQTSEQTIGNGLQAEISES